MNPLNFKEFVQNKSKNEKFIDTSTKTKSKYSMILLMNIKK